MMCSPAINMSLSAFIQPATFFFPHATAAFAKKEAFPQPGKGGGAFDRGERWIVGI